MFGLGVLELLILAVLGAICLGVAIGGGVLAVVLAQRNRKRPTASAEDETGA